ncbi:hypothetical protein Pint_03145 [Pistacia integerrima]|uniref:Uncharacterized protein n=1 Tax=Pistacia integerrima TaxID=434235 RepID=A0ACC0ZHZ7_9ROSI|nr:hypothetical protein Pint_03145 [Pistacia integerrima]
MSQADVSYSCGSCGYPLNLSSLNRIASGIGSEYQKSIKKGFISFLSVDLSRFTQVDEAMDMATHLRFVIANKVDMEDPSGDGRTYIMHLPDDCLCHIFQGLRGCSDHVSFGLTCHRWLKIQNLCRRSLEFQCSFSQPSQTTLNINSYHLYRLLTRFQHLEFLSLCGCTELPDSGLNQLQYYGSKLQTIILDCCFRITDNGLSQIGAWCPSITSISLYRCNVTDAGLEILANACSTLMHVNLSYCLQISDCGLKVLSQRCSQLGAVKISCCSGITGVGFRGCSATLAYIDAESCNLRPEGITGIVSGGGLEILNVSSINWLGQGGLAAIGTGYASRLKILNFRMCRSVGDAAIMAIAKGCPLLKEWNLAICHGVGFSGWESIGLNCNNLVKLHVNRCRNLCPRGLDAIRDGCRRLLVLYMNQNPRISTYSIELFKLYRGDVEIKEEEIICVGPDWKDH